MIANPFKSGVFEISVAALGESRKLNGNNNTARDNDEDKRRFARLKCTGHTQWDAMTKAGPGWSLRCLARVDQLRLPQKSSPDRFAAADWHNEAIQSCQAVVDMLQTCLGCPCLPPPQREAARFPLDPSRGAIPINTDSPPSTTRPGHCIASPDCVDHSTILSHFFPGHRPTF